MKIGVLMGGKSNERDISLMSGGEVVKALKGLGLNFAQIDPAGDFCGLMKKEKIDIAFIALHGRYGEDGCVQGALEVMGVPYTGSGVKASAIAMSKSTTKVIAKAIGAKTPQWRIVRKSAVDDDMANLDLEAPVVVKPDGAGSSVGITICHDDGEINDAVALAFESDDTVIVEQFIKGALVTVGIVGEEILPPIEIEPVSGFYDFSHKYKTGETVYHIPARIDRETLDDLREMTLKIHRTLGCSGMSRSEFIVDESGIGWFLELNTIPGLTANSLLPKAAAADGMTFEDLTLAILGEAVGNA